MDVRMKESSESISHATDSQDRLGNDLEVDYG